jgi:hypothetical protein
MSLKYPFPKSILGIKFAEANNLLIGLKVLIVSFYIDFVKKIQPLSFDSIIAFIACESAQF